MGNKDAHLHIFDQEGGSHQVTHLALTLTTYWQDSGDVTCTDEQKMGGAVPPGVVVMATTADIVVVLLSCVLYCFCEILERY